MRSARVILGTMTFSGQTNKADATTMLKAFARSPLATPGATLAQIDSARMYGAGKTEALIGEILAEDEELRSLIHVASKAHPFMGSVLSTASVNEQANGSLASLQAESVDLWYLHGPCAKTPIEETLAAVQSLFEAGKFARFGLSNFTAWETVWIHGYMEKKGWVVPQVYQGMLNVTTRAVVSALFPALRRLGMKFNAYNPLAGGMLTVSGAPRAASSPCSPLPAAPRSRAVASSSSRPPTVPRLPRCRDAQGKYSREQVVDTGRFEGATPWGKIYQQRFMQPLQFDAVDILRSACAEASIPMHEGGCASLFSLFLSFFFHRLIVLSLLFFLLRCTRSGAALAHAPLPSGGGRRRHHRRFQVRPLREQPRGAEPRPASRQRRRGVR